MSGSIKRLCFVDSNIWLYALIETDDRVKSEVASRLLDEITPVVSTQVVNEVSVNFLRKAPVTEVEVRQLIESFFAKYAVIETDKTIFLSASSIRERYSISYWDSMIVASALQAGVAVLYSEDMQHGLKVEQQLEIRNPFNGLSK